MAWYTLRNTDEIDSPALLLYPERVKENIALLKSSIDNVTRLRPHVKTVKMPEVVRLMQEAGINKFKCATIAEAEMLGIVQAADVLLAYQPVGPKIARLAALVEQYPQTKYACLVDDITAATAISDHFAAKQQRLPVWLDLNLGQNRTGITPGAEALELYAQLSTLPGITLVGLHAYDGHLHDADLTLRTKRCNDAYAGVTKLAKSIAIKGLPVPLIVAGGSPTFPIHAQRPEIECSPGTFAFWDWGYAQGLPEQHYQPAVLVMARVISHPAPHLVCLDLGHKSVAAENQLPKRVHFINAAEAVPVSQSEEHLVIKVLDNAAYPIGTVLYGIPYHICPTVALYDSAHIISEQNLEGVWKITARNRSILI
ncbi:D-TA family PLP-dependent enzyme [Chitinophaga agrisoli]|uniref:D-TA family PLP-dependent enzyme n=1 Tax=Chitinophaga agrisoli TaxID=2607653 RepID=A0A5B2VNB8_9BACT|nr:D-TA family PLP-dependent enzyme [Chitinophaga agrisoli]KAA2240591.1 D-TA family PLP-dependent enzyme [Chitinophaga agrisoli]